MRVRIIRVNVQDLTKFLFGFVECFVLQETQAEIVVGNQMMGIDSNRFVPLLPRLCIFPFLK